VDVNNYAVLFTFGPKNRTWVLNYLFLQHTKMMHKPEYSEGREDSRSNHTCRKSRAIGILLKRTWRQSSHRFKIMI